MAAKHASGVCDPGERGVVYERYELGDRPGWSVIFRSGRHDGFSPCDVDFFLDVSGEVCEELAGYPFRERRAARGRLRPGRFEPALGAVERWPAFWSRAQGRTVQDGRSDAASDRGAG